MISQKQNTGKLRSLHEPAVRNSRLRNSGSSARIPNFKIYYSWISRDIINLTRGQLQIDTLSLEGNFSLYMFDLWQQICAISWHLFTPVQYNHQHILGWPPLRFAARCPGETQEFRLYNTQKLKNSTPGIYKFWISHVSLEIQSFNNLLSNNRYDYRLLLGYNTLF